MGSQWLKITVFLIFVLLNLASCRKEKIEVLAQLVSSNTTFTLSDLFFLDENTGFACGGDRFRIGVFLKTTDGGRTWSAPDSVMPKQAYATYFFNPQRGFVTGFDSWFSQTFDGGQNFSSWTMPAYLPIHDVVFGNSGCGIMVGGAGVNSGVIYNTINGGASWNESTSDFKMECVAWVEEKKYFAAGYGVLMKTENAGETWHYDGKVKGDFFKDITFPTSKTGYLIGWQGAVFKTKDGGDSWKKIHQGNNGFNKRVYLQAVDFFDAENGAIVGENGLVYVTNDGGNNWKDVKPFTSSNLYDVHLFNANSGIVCGEKGEVFLVSW